MFLKQRFGILLVLLVLAISCHNDEKKVTLPDEPENLIAKEKMVQVLTDVHLLEAALSNHTSKNPSAFPGVRANGNELEEEASVVTVAKKIPYYDIFKKHGVTRTQYENSINWYAAQPEVYNEMYADVITELSRRQTQNAVKK
ncbi:MAG: DUF4296 domain-containing protein [Bacteroidia bacterium]